jgi:NTE family protein
MPDPTAVEPVTRSPGRAGRPPEPGIALCLSGGGYRAMLFHVGSLWRLNELGYLKRLKRISSVSGGSITAGRLALSWPRLDFDSSGVARQFDAEVARPIRGMASQTIDRGAILRGTFLPGEVSDRVVAAYQEHLFGKATLQDLPDDPQFVINATNVQSGVLWRFSRHAMRDYRVGSVPHPTLPLAVAVAASSAFPPVLSPVKITLDPSLYAPPTGGEDLHRTPFTTNVVLTDGGVYDNLGLETAWKRFDTILVSDGGGKMAPEPEPHADWVRHSIRINAIIDNQVRSLRKRQVIDAFESGVRKGAYWGIRTNIADYHLPDALPCPLEATTALANFPTRLKAVDEGMQDRLINWGYAVCDSAIRRHVGSAPTAPGRFPYVGTAVG